MVQSAYKCGDASGRPGISSEFATDDVTSERRNRLAAIAVFCNGVKSKTAPDLGLSYKSTFVLLHKLCEAMAEKMKSRVVGGEGKEAEIDGGYFGGYVKRANRRKIGSIAVSLKTSMASARSSLSFANVVAHRSPQCWVQRAQPLRSSALASRRALVPVGNSIMLATDIESGEAPALCERGAFRSRASLEAENMILRHRVAAEIVETADRPLAQTAYVRTKNGWG
jgi:hypothetical protein